MKDITHIFVVGLASIFSMEMIEKFLKIAPLISYGVQWSVGIATLIYILLKIKYKFYANKINKKDA